MISGTQRAPALIASGLLATWVMVFAAFSGMFEMLRNFKVDFPALSLLTVNVLHMANGLLWPCAVVAIAILLFRRAALSWYSALALCLLCDVLALGIALPLLILSYTVATPPHPTQLPLWTAVPLLALGLNQIVLVLLYVKRREFFAK